MDSEERQLAKEFVTKISKEKKTADIKAKIYKYLDMSFTAITISAGSLVVITNNMNDHHEKLTNTILGATITILNSLSKGFDFVGRAEKLKSISVSLDALHTDLEVYLLDENLTDEQIREKIKSTDKTYRELDMKLFLTGTNKPT